MKIDRTLLFLFCLILIGVWFFVEEKTTSTLYNFDTEIKTHYTLEFKQNSSLISSDLLPGKFTYNFAVEAMLNMRVLQKEGEFYWLAYQLSKFDLSGEGVTKDMLERLKPYYSSMFLVKVDFFGKITEMHFGGVDINFAGLKQLLYLLEVISLDKNNYKLLQRDSIGTYSSFYRKNLYLIEKQKNKYTKVFTPDERYKVKVEKFSLLAKVDAKANWLKSLNLKENLLIRDENKMPYAKNKNIIKLQKSDEIIDTSLQIWQENRSVQEILTSFNELKNKDENIFEVIQNENSKKQFISSQTNIDSLIHELNKNSKDGSVYRKIAKFIKLFPDKTSELKSIIMEADDSVALRMLSMLSLVGTPEAQELLVDVANSGDTSHMNNIRAIIGLGGVDVSTQKTIDALMELSDARGADNLNDKSNTSILALGAHAQYASSQNEDIISYIRSEYNSDISLDREKNILYSMQNAGAENFIAEIENSLNSKSIKVRIVAIKTIGTIKDVSLRESLLKQQQLKQNNTKVKELIDVLLERK